MLRVASLPQGDPTEEENNSGQKVRGDDQRVQREVQHVDQDVIVVIDHGVKVAQQKMFELQQCQAKLQEEIKSLSHNLDLPEVFQQDFFNYRMYRICGFCGISM